MLVATFAPQARAQEARLDPAVKATIFLPFDFYGRNREALGLNADQAREMERLAESIREPAKSLESERAARSRALMATMAKSPVDLDLAMARFQAVLEAENEAKALQFRASIAMRNTLTSEQLRQLHALATKDATRVSGVPAVLHERIQQLRAELQKRGEPPRAVMAQLKQIEQTAREGRAGDAKAQLEELLRQLRQEREASRNGEQAAPSKDSPR
jgi:hypothetical protein